MISRLSLSVSLSLTRMQRWAEAPSRLESGAGAPRAPAGPDVPFQSSPGHPFPRDLAELPPGGEHRSEPVLGVQLEQEYTAYKISALLFLL